MKESWAVAFCTLCLTGCYTPNDQRFATHVQTLVEAGMPMEAAIAALEADGFVCDPALPDRSKTCSKIRERLLPSTCVERVNLYASDIQPGIARVDVRKIVCAGL